MLEKRTRPARSASRIAWSSTTASLSAPWARSTSCSTSPRSTSSTYSRTFWRRTSPTPTSWRTANATSSSCATLLYITTQDIYAIVSTPNVDIDKLSEFIVKAIGAAKARCDKAFRLVENSVDMLKTGMSSYYKDFVASGNPTIIIENFINDISTDLKIDTPTLGQFKRIIFYFRRQASKKLKGVFFTLDKIMEIMEGGTPGRGKVGNEDITDDESDESAEPPATFA
ncbi:hypothetical protein P3T76_014157 [Phytophthora citrophthora]|uniref:Uncharacterized protein n=1 Tax=Phytophthora citrophthora TaxID=4793 RepID=A0AAD9LBN3_9STRA|nr:hypothetical protein P3T76_014157 [Phytophthora citrophthora]